jgi:nucleotide-binding universal stress UspA family protein
MKNILVPFDFSDESVNALHIAHEISKKGKINIVLCHAIDLAIYSDTSSELDDSYIAQLLDTVQNKIESHLINAKISTSEISIKIKMDHPFSYILDLVKKKKINLIIMGSKGSRNWRGIMIGSTTQKVIRHSTCPALIVQNRTDIGKIKDIVFATDLSITPHFVIRALIELQELLEAKVNVLKVITPNSWGIDREIKKQMKQFVKLYDFKNYSMNIYNDVDAENGIIHYSEDINVGLIALASHKKIDIPTIITDYRVTERVIENSDRLVWVCGIGYYPG